MKQNASESYLENYWLKRGDQVDKMTISELYAALQAASEARTTALLNVEAKDKALKAATIDFDAAKATAASAEMTFVSSIDAMIAALQALKPKPA